MLLRNTPSLIKFPFTGGDVSIVLLMFEPLLHFEGIYDHSFKRNFFFPSLNYHVAVKVLQNKCSLLTNKVAEWIILCFTSKSEICQLCFSSLNIDDDVLWLEISV